MILPTNTLASELLRNLGAYWRAATYLSVGQFTFTTMLEVSAAAIRCETHAARSLGTATGQHFITLSTRTLIGIIRK